MAEGGGGGFRPDTEKKLDPKSSGLPESLDHRGLWFKSARADEQTDLARSRVDRDTPTALHLLDIVRAEQQDIRYQKRANEKDKTKFAKSEGELKKVVEVIVDYAAGEKPTEKEEELVQGYLERHKKRWTIKAEAEKDDVRKAEDEANAEFFAALQTSIFSSQELREQALALDGEIEDALEGVLEPIPNYDEIDLFTPNAYEHLKTLLDKEFTVDDFPGILQAIETDISEQEQKYNSDNPGWKDKKTAVGSAVMFYAKAANELGEDAMIDRIIHVYEGPNGTTASWDKPPRGAKKSYAFSLNPSTDDPNHDNYLGQQLHDVAQFDGWRKLLHGSRKDDLDPVHIVGANDIVKKIQSGEEIDVYEADTMRKLIGLVVRQGALETDEHTAEKALETYDTMTKMISEAAGESEIDDPWDMYPGDEPYED